MYIKKKALHFSIYLYTNVRETIIMVLFALHF